MGAAMVAGFEGDDVNSKYHVASCMKHFIGYGSTTTGKTEPLVLYERLLRQFDPNYLPSSNKRGQKIYDQFW
jgi:beta-glucosidase